MLLHALLTGAILFISIPGQALSQIVFSGEAAVHVLQTDRTIPNRTTAQGRSTFGWRADFFADAIVAENVSFLSGLRVFQNEDPTFDFLAIRVMDLPLGLNLQVGKFDIPFGNLGERRFAMRNTLYTLPAPYDYATALPSERVSTQDLQRRRGAGGGMRLMDFGIYDIGAMVYGSYGIVGFAAALTNGTVSAPGNRALNTNGDFGKVLRITVEPLQGWILGGGLCFGAYLADAAQDTARLGRVVNVRDYKQYTAEIDAEATIGHLAVYAQGTWSDSRYPLELRDEHFRAFGYNAEVSYAVTPRITLAARLSGIRFDDARLDDTQPQASAWDDDILDIEGGLVYRIDRNVLAKLAWRHSRLAARQSTISDQIVSQLAVRF